MDGNKIAISSRDTVVRIFDVRSKVMESETQSHKCIRDSRVLFVNNDYLLTTGYFFRQKFSVQCEVILIQFIL